MLEAKLRVPVERRALSETKRQAKQKLQEERSAANLAQAALQESAALETATNRTGEPYFGRYQTLSGRGQY